VRVIGESGEMLGVMPTRDALDAARDAGVDLVEISPNAEPPVVKIIDWGKYQYQQAKEANKAKKNSKNGEVKEMRIGLKIGAGDLETKLKKVREFLADGDKVKLQVVFKGREMAHKEIGFAKLDDILQMLEDVAIAENKPTMGGRFLNIMVRAKK
jgi:translation initiation factor IF-3